VFGVRSSRGVKWLVVALLLPLTLGWKLAVRPTNLGDLPDRHVQQQVTMFLAKQRFSVLAADKVEEGQPMLRATSGTCRLLAAKSPAMGWDRDLIRRHSAQDDDVFTVFRGRIYSEQPTWLTVPNFLWARFRRELGLRVSAEPVLAIVATKICGAERLPWAELEFSSQY
jgi:hypothetical protein